VKAAFRANNSHASFARLGGEYPACRAEPDDDDISLFGRYGEND